MMMPWVVNSPSEGTLINWDGLLMALDIIL